MFTLVFCANSLFDTSCVTGYLSYRIVIVLDCFTDLLPFILVLGKDLTSLAFAPIPVLPVRGIYGSSSDS